MSRGQTEVPGLLVALTSLLLLIAAAGHDCWRQGAKDQLTSVGLSSRCRGLWGECVHDSLVGLRTCDVSVSYMEHLPADMLAMRAALVGMCVLSVVSVLLMIPGLRGTTLIHSVPVQDRLLRVSGALCLCGAVCGAAGLLWYGVDTYTRYRREVTLGMPGITLEFGLSYWLMVGSVFCSLTSAVLPVCPPQLDELPLPPLPETPTVCLSADQVNTQLKKLHAGKAAGPDGVSPRVLKANKMATDKMLNSRLQKSTSPQTNG